MSDNYIILASWKSQNSNGIDTSRFTMNFLSPIQLDNNYDYELAFDSLESYYSFPNVIDGKNNKFAYTKNGTQTILSLPTGCYNLEDINSTIKTLLGVDKDNITIQSVQPELKSLITIQPNFTVDFTVPNSINTILGFKSGVLNPGTTKSDNIVNIHKTNTIFVNCDLVSNSFFNGINQNVIHSFFPNVDPGFKIVETAPRLSFLPIKNKTISSIILSLTNQDGEFIDFRGDTVSIRLQLRRIR